MAGVGRMQSIACPGRSRHRRGEQRLVLGAAGSQLAAEQRDSGDVGRQPAIESSLPLPNLMNPTAATSPAGTAGHMAVSLGHEAPRSK